MLSVSTRLGARLWVRLLSNTKLEPPHFHSLLFPNPKCLLKHYQLKGTLCPQHRLSLTQTPLVFHCLKLKLLNSMFEIWAPSCPSILLWVYRKMAWQGSPFCFLLGVDFLPEVFPVDFLIPELTRLKATTPIHFS